MRTSAADLPAAHRAATEPTIATARGRRDACHAPDLEPRPIARRRRMPWLLHETCQLSRALRRRRTRTAPRAQVPRMFQDGELSPGSREFLPRISETRRSPGRGGDPPFAGASLGNFA